MSRPPLLLLPGMLCNEELFAHQIAYLSDVAEISVGDITRDGSISGTARTVLNEAPERFALAGLSLGGIVAFEILRQAPERVERLALLDTNSHSPTRRQLESWDKFREMTNEGRFEQVVEEYLLPTYFHWKDPGLEKTAVQMASRVGEEAFLRQLSVQADRPDSTGDLSGIRCPTLAACGRHDSLCPVPMHEEMSAAIDGSRLVVVEDSGHLSSMEQPQAVTSALRHWIQEDGG